MHLKRKILIVTFFVGFLFLFSINIRSSFAEVDPLQLQVPIPGAKGDSVSADGTIKFDNKTTAIAEYIKNIYNYAISIVGIVATIMLMFGGFTWLTAGGSGEKVGKARDIIFGALTGLVLALTSYTILTLINPDLVNFKIQSINTPIIKKVTTTALSEGEACTSGEPPFCDFGLYCENKTCQKTPISVTNSSSGKYQWKSVSDCSTLGKTNYGDSFCTSPKPNNQSCCGIYN